MPQFLVATQNKHKLQEYRELLDELGDIEWLTLADVGLGEMDVEENGHSFAENARIKAWAYHQASGLITFADDSGLVVDAVGGEPGIYSARYGAPDAVTDADRYNLLLQKMADVPIDQRQCRFMCVVAMATSQHQSMAELPVAVGKVEGTLGYAPRGTNGFGYDPIFQLPDGRMLAELPSAEKNQISHRGDALRNALPLLRELLK